jgi:hypothetical protein
MKCHKCNNLDENPRVEHTPPLVVSYQNVYTKIKYVVCDRHDKFEFIGDVQTTMGAHVGDCEFCKQTYGI